MAKFNDKYNDKHSGDKSNPQEDKLDLEMEKMDKNSFFSILKKNIYIIVPFILFFLMILGYVLNSDWGVKKNLTKKDISELKPEYYVNLKDIMVSLSDNSGKKSYLKLSLSIHLSEDYEVKQVEAKLPIIKDTIQVFLKDLRVSDFNYPGVTLKIKEELTKRVNKVVSPLEIKDVLLQDILVN